MRKILLFIAILVCLFSPLVIWAQSPPAVAIVIYDQRHIYPGQYLTNINQFGPNGGQWALIVNSDGAYEWSIPESGQGLEYRPEIDDYTHWNGDAWVVRDGETLSVTAIFSGSTDYITDGHDLIFSPDGARVWTLVYSDMFQIEKNTSLLVRNFGIEEYGWAGQGFVRGWYAQDHLDITKSNPFTTSNGALNWLHGNSLDYTDNGNILASFRQYGLVLICWDGLGEDGQPCTPGDVLGVASTLPSNEFDFVNDKGFCYQHDIEQLPDGQIMLFDNGNCRGKSRAVVYDVDWGGLIMTRTWEYTRDIFAPFTGSVQQLPNDNILIGWGGATVFTTAVPFFSEVAPGGNLIAEGYLSEPGLTYRVNKHAKAKIYLPLMGR